MVNIGLVIDTGRCIAIQVLNYELALGFGLENGMKLKGIYGKMCNEGIRCFDIEDV
jgi:hypothetical protein